MMEIRNLEDIDFDTLIQGFERAFADYEIHFEKDEVRSMLKRRGYNPKLSFAAFDNGGIVAFTLNGTGLFNGVPTAYDTGTGTAKDYRGQGLAGRIFSHSISYLKDSGIRQYLLEVLQNNSNAIAVYRRMNFETAREFNCFRQVITDIRKQGRVVADCKIESVGIDFVCKSQSFCEFCPSWQNSMESIERGVSELQFLGATINGLPAGCCVFDPNSGDLTQIAVDRGFRRRGIASRLLEEAIKRMKTDFVKVINVESGGGGLTGFLESKNIPLASRQFEMLRQF